MKLSDETKRKLESNQQDQLQVKKPLVTNLTIDLIQKAIAFGWAERAKVDDTEEDDFYCYPAIPSMTEEFMQKYHIEEEEK